MAAGAKEARDKRLRWWQLAKGWGGGVGVVGGGAVFFSRPGLSVGYSSNIALINKWTIAIS